MKILMVEDHEMFAKNVVSAFLAEHDVTVVPSIAAAKRELRARNFDILLVDYDLEDGKGDQLVRWARTEAVAGKVIATSSHEHGNEMLEAAGADARCSKMEFSKISEALSTTPADHVPAVSVELEHVAFTQGHGKMNEDRAEVFDFGDRLVAVVVDGAGGTGGGHQAAEIVVERVRASAEHLRDAPGIAAVLRVLDLELFRTGPAGECAGLLVVINDGRVQGASVGDCEAWAVGKHAVDVLTQNQVRKPLLGTGEATVMPFIASLPATLMLATDGLTKYAAHDRVMVQLRSDTPLDTMPSGLVDLVRLSNGEMQDDVGFVIVRALGAGSRVDE